MHTGVLNAIFLIDGYDDVENKIFSWLNKNTNETVFILKIVVINNVIIMLDRSKS